MTPPPDLAEDSDEYDKHLNVHKLDLINVQEEERLRSAAAGKAGTKAGTKGKGKDGAKRKPRGKGSCKPPGGGGPGGGGGGPGGGGGGRGGGDPTKKTLPQDAMEVQQPKASGGKGSKKDSEKDSDEVVIEEEVRGTVDISGSTSASASASVVSASPGTNVNKRPVSHAIISQIKVAMPVEKIRFL